MSWDQTYSHTFLIALDEWGAAVFFNRLNFTISTMCRLVRDGQDAPLKLNRWQRAFLKWLEPRLSESHCAAALQADLERLKTGVILLASDPDQARALLAQLS